MVFDLLEYFYSVRLVAGVKDLLEVSSVHVAPDGDGKEGSKDDSGLERVGPHDGFDSALWIHDCHFIC